MELLVPSHLPLPLRAWVAFRTRGSQYAWHKFLRRTLRHLPGWKRRMLYADPRQYWSLRGGIDYFREQEAQELRTLRAEWLADHIAAYRPASILEVGCGYGKLLKCLRERLEVPLTGIDFSPTQLGMARQYLHGLDEIALVHATGERLPFAAGAFDMVITSAVILHNPPETAERVRREVVRVARRFAAHNEETDVTYNRFGYDTAAWYRVQGYPLAEAGPIPFDPDSTTSQFCVARVS